MDNSVQVEIRPEQIIGRIYYKEMLSQDDFVNMVGCITALLIKQPSVIGIQPYRMEYLMNLVTPIVYGFTQSILMMNVKRTKRGNEIAGKAAIQLIDDNINQLLDKINRSQHYYVFKAIDLKSCVAHVA